MPEHLIGDKAYDSNGLDRQLDEGYAIEVMTSHRRNRRRTQYDRLLRRYRRRWKIEHLFAWLDTCRLVTRWEFHVHNFLGMVQLACAMLLVRHL